MIRALVSFISKLFKNPAFKDSIPVRGKVKLVLRDSRGRVKTIRKSNTIQDAGKYAITDQLLASPTLGKPTHAGVGDGSITMGELGNELVRVALTSKDRTTNVLTMVFDLPAGTGTGALTEAGIYDAGAAGNCLSTTSFTAIPKGAADTLEITWTWTIGT